MRKPEVLFCRDFGLSRFQRMMAFRHALFLLLLYVELHLHRTVVAAHHVGVNVGGSNFVTQTVRDKEIVDAPPSVLLASAEAV